MKKTSMLIILSAILLCIYTVSFAEGSVITEASDVKVVFDGKAAMYGNVPIIANDRILLPLRDILGSLGVSNEDIDKTWNGNDQSITVKHQITKNGKAVPVKINLKVDRNAAFVDDSPVLLDTAPVMYNDRVYIPARFISQSLGKKVVWEASTSTVIIRDESEFNRVREILQKSRTAANAAATMSMDTEISADISQFGRTFALLLDGRGEMNKTVKLFHMEIKPVSAPNDMSSEMYLANGVKYSKDPFSGKWEKKALTNDMYDNEFENKDISMIVNSDDIFCAGLSVADSTNPDEIFLKGDIYPNGLMNRLSINIRPIERYELGKGYAELILDKKTYLPKKMYFTAKGNFVSGREKPELSLKVNVLYGAYNGKQDIVVPDDAVNSAAETEK